ncbi:TetR/AcrR family transcriptional regulator [Ilumatobacter nonamiensis]|uniref:TetR/AcrR family transcriptional regulator n=1 Tax=Ilumatobacter nonamiensis TaxID=467093 RepID=UPI00034C7DDA|nr:TetR/AcrR family transcriptional regulator [Ilumatobacter nonamiensis]
MTSRSVDPRVERSRQLICSAAIDEMAEVGYGAMTIESIAKRAGVGKATVYRHWDGKLDLVESALDLVKADMVVPADGSTRDRLVVMLTWLAEFLAGDSSASACLPALVSAAQYDDSVRDFHHRFGAERRQAFIDVIDEGCATGEIDPSLDARLVAETLVGPLFHRRMFTPDPYPPDEVAAIVDLVLPT